MERTAAIMIMSALAQPTRLEVFALLSGADGDGLTAGQIAEGTGTPANTMSSHLLIMTRAGLVEPRRAGRNIFYRALPGAVGELTRFLGAIGGSPGS